MICVATAQNRGKYTDLGYYVVDVSRSAEGKVFLFSSERLEGVSRKLLSLGFLNSQLLAKRLNFIFIEVTWKVGYLRSLNFFTRKLSKRTHFMFPLKMINLFQDMMPNFSPRNVDLEVSRPAIFMINWTQLKSINH